MKKISFVSLVFAFMFVVVCINLNAGEGKEYTWQQAKSHIGETATVCGKIIDAVPFGPAITILGMGVGVMTPGAVGIEIPNSMKSKLPADLFKGKEVCVTGQIYKNPAGGGSIKVSVGSQIVAK